MRINPFSTTPNILNHQQNRQSCKIKYNNLSPLKQDTVSFGAMKKQEFSGIDRVCVDKFKAPIEKFNTNDDLQDWAGKKLQTILTTDYEGRREETKIQRKALIKEWGDYLTKENDAYNNTAGLLVMSAITKDLDPNNDELPPCLNKGVLADVMSKVDNGENINILKDYKTKLRNQYFEETDTGEVGKKWIEIPSKEHDPENFEKNVDKLKTLSHKNWCTHSFNAEPYLSEGDFHILLDNGKPRLGVRFVGESIQEIQGAQNNSEIPLDYFDDANEHVKSNDYKLEPKAKNELECAEIINEELKTAKEELKPAIENNDIPKILGFFNIETDVDDKGMCTISHYNLAKTGRVIKPVDLGVNENKIFKNIKHIKGDINLYKSTLTDIGALEDVGGDVFLKFSQINDLGNLKIIGGDVKFNDKIKSLKNLERVGGNIDFTNSEIEDLGALKYIGGDAIFKKDDFLAFKPASKKEFRKTKTKNLKSEMNKSQKIKGSKLTRLDFRRVEIGGKLIAD